MLDISTDAVSLTRALVDIESVSGDERALADQVEAALSSYPSLEVVRFRDCVLARTSTGATERVVLAGHLDTVPIAGNVPSRHVGDRIYGCGTSDMKSGVALQLRAAHLVGSGAVAPACDLTWIFYECEEVEASRNGLAHIADELPQWVAADLAVLLEPTSGVIEGGCQGTIRIEVRTVGRRAHSARSWLGSNAIHSALDILERLVAYSPRTVDIDGLTYREGLNAVRIAGGIAGNVIPDECVVTINFRFAPDRSETSALAHLAEVFDGYELTVTDTAPGSLPGLSRPAAARFAAAVGGTPAAKLGWTDVARFSALGIPALNFGPGDPNLAHTVDEWVSADLIEQAEAALIRFLEAK